MGSQSLWFDKEQHEIAHSKSKIAKFSSDFFHLFLIDTA